MKISWLLFNPQILYKTKQLKMRRMYGRRVIDLDCQQKKYKAGWHEPIDVTRTVYVWVNVRFEYITLCLQANNTSISTAHRQHEDVFDHRSSALSGGVLTRAEAPAASGPYPPSGWKPSGRLLVLPARQQVSQVYGPPPAEYGPPPQEYGPPATEAATTETATEEQPTEQPEDAAESPEGQSERLVDSGVYYVLQPDGNLQMVRYTTAPLKAQKQVQQKVKFQRQQKFQGNRFAEASNNNFESQRLQQQRTQVQAHQAQFQPKPAQFNQQPAQFNQQPAQFNQQPSQFNQQTAQFNQQPAQFNQQPQPFHYVEIQKSQEIQVAQPAQEPAVGFVANVQYRDVEPISSPVYAYNPAPLVRILKK
ncbi:ataxin-2 homolog [Homalodisca vitripennis]|uniref:ataxin-2 homolog n=1 Tax=Homalodisca vitripennis TaxID=197043 RepID=UPI001EEBD650|nr:ataxin-2 homolog [Homalodisca vitripennis]